MGGSKIPSPPDPNVSAQAGIISDTANYPFQAIINSLAQTGGKQTINGTTYDFTGQGNADQSNSLSDQAAQALLDIQQNYGSQFIQQRLADLKQSDPQGYAARQQLFDKILADSQTSPDRPLAQDLQDQVSSMLGDAGKLDKQGLQEVQQGVRAGQVARGIYRGNAPASEEASAVVNASDALRSNQQQQASAYLQSGVSPSDVAYRRIQQSLSDLGAFVNNQTPEAQFGSLSSAGNGAAPFNPVNYQQNAPLSPQQSAANGLNFANTQYAQNSGYANSQANPWLTGLTTGVNALGAAASLGANPFAPTSPPASISGGGYTSPGGTFYAPTSAVPSYGVRP